MDEIDQLKADGEVYEARMKEEIKAIEEASA
jgi:hypothetical protein